MLRKINMLKVYIDVVFTCAVDQAMQLLPQNIIMQFSKYYYAMVQF